MMIFFVVCILVRVCMVKVVDIGVFGLVWGCVVCVGGIG